MKITKRLLPLIIIGTLAIYGCSKSEPGTDKSINNSDQITLDSGDWTTNKGVGPITEISLNEVIDEAMVEEGKSIFTTKCSACHKPNKKYIGPAMADILDRRTPEWTMNMILNPDGMVKEDPIAKDLLMEYNGTPMANQNLSEDEARAVLEYIRTLKSE